MKIFSITLSACLLVLSPLGYSQGEEEAATVVAEELSEEAAILRALVEEYKTKKTIPAGSTSMPNPVPTEKRPVISPLDDYPVPLTESLNKKVEKASTAVSNAIPKPEFKIDPLPKPKPNMVDTESLSSLADELKQLQEESQPRAAIKAMDPTVPSIESIIPTPTTPSAPQVVEEMAEKVEVKAQEMTAPSESISSVASLISNPIESVSSVISEAEANITPPAAEMKETIASIDSIVIADTPVTAPKIEAPMVDKSDIPSIEDIQASIKADPPAPEQAVVKAPSSSSIILRDDPPAAPIAAEIKAMEPPVIADIGNKTEAVVAAATDEVEKAAELEGSVMKSALQIEDQISKPITVETPQVAIADEMKADTTPKPEIAVKTEEKKAAIEKKVPDANKPLVVATKKPAPKPAESADKPAEAATETAAAASTPPQPAVTARSATPLKDLGRKLFGPKDGTTPRGPIFKRRNRNTGATSQ